jgi:hypothetical protein
MYFDASFGGSSLGNIGYVNRAATVGTDIAITAQGAAAGSSNLNGGSIYFFGGTATGNGTSTIRFNTAGGGGAGTADKGTTLKMIILGDGRTGVSVASPTAMLHLPASNASSNTAPLKFNKATALLAVPEVGAVEYDASTLYYTDSGANRLGIIPAAYAELTGLSFSLSSGFTNLTTLTGGSSTISKYVLVDTSTCTILSGGEGVYKIEFNAYAQGATNCSLDVYIYKNGASVAKSEQTSNTTVDSPTSWPVNSKPILLSMTAGDKIQVRGQYAGVITGSVGIINGVLVMYRIGTIN